MNFEELRNLFDLCLFIGNKTEKELIQYLQAERLLKPLKKCGKCRNQTILAKNISFKGNYAAWCRKCRRFKSLSAGTFFEATGISFNVILILLWCWAAHMSPKLAVSCAPTHVNTVKQYYQFFRDVAYSKLLNSPPAQLGGPGRVIHIDEYVVAKENYNCGHCVPERRLLGILDTTSGRGFVQFIKGRDADTVIPIIQEHVVPGSTIWTTCWAAYNSLGDLGFDHHTVNHSRVFVAADGTCSMESYWYKLRQICKSIDVPKSFMLEEHIDEFLWREEFCQGLPVHEVFLTILRHMKEKYPV